MKIAIVALLSLTLSACVQKLTPFEGTVRMKEGEESTLFRYRKLGGDFIITFNNGPGGREAATIPGPWGIRISRTAGEGAPLFTAQMNQQADVLEVERKGDTVFTRTAAFGSPYAESYTVVPDMGAEVYAGVFSARMSRKEEEMYLTNLRIVTPARPAAGQRTVLSSQVEILDPFTGVREIVYEEGRSLQAPNWTLDGKALLYNADGLMYRLDLATRKPSLLPTGAVKANNNDHVISFDGKMLGLSSDERDRGGSVIYTVPVEGGEPRLVTPRGPSYLHGWSPDGQHMVYVAMRPGANHFDVYRVPAAGGEEVRLTDAPGLDDGPEYSPDGKYIYFNSNRTGTMLLYRMKADGSEQEALTDGQFHDWFPHISPDGKWIAFLSFRKDEVDSGDHPFYKHVYLRLMPASGGPAQIVAYLYGGQGTINTPSWSPDSRRLAFVSNGGVGF